MKKLTLSLFALTLVLGLARMISHFTIRPDLKIEEWITFQKHPHHPNLVRSHASTKTEKQLVNIPTMRKQDEVKREPAQTKEEKLKKLSYKGREIFNFLDKEQKNIGNLGALNRPSEDWKGKAAGKLLRFQDPSTKLFMMPQKSLVKIEENGARYVEIVEVKFLTKKGKRTSYSALIDSQSGELIRSWNQSIQDSVFSRKDKVDLTATGNL